MASEMEATETGSLAASLTSAGTADTIASEPSSVLLSGEEVSFIETGARKLSKRVKILDDDEPLIDTTAALPLRSKKTERAQKRLEKTQQKAARVPSATNLLDLPPELLQDVCAYLTPSDLYLLLQVNKSVRDFVLENQNSITREIIRRRYWVLAKCFPLPVAFSSVDQSSHAALLNEKRQNMLQMHKKPYQHIKGFDPLKICSCHTCVFAWNNLCLILDLSHWQKNFKEREPIPMIPRGSAPQWNKTLIEANAAAVERAMTCRLDYAAILEKHLKTTIGTIVRTVKGKKTMHPNRLYHLTPADADTDTDEFLERSGPPCHVFPWHRDNYYNLEAYVPNRRWSKEDQRWIYYTDGLHEKDLKWAVEYYGTKSPKEREFEAFLASFNSKTT